MSQPNKKSSSSQPSAKLASNMAGKAAKNTFAAVESTRNSAEHVVKLGSSAMQDFLNTGAGEAQKAQEKLFAASREQAEQVAKSADAVTKAMYDAVSSSRDNVETLMECGNLTASMAKDVSGELYEYANRAFAEQIEYSKEFFACRTFNDLFELQNKMTRNMMDQFFNESVKLSGMLFEYSSEALEPLNERMAEATQQLGKSFAA